jgi:hypothetical protein
MAVANVPQDVLEKVVGKLLDEGRDIRDIVALCIRLKVGKGKSQSGDLAVVVSTDAE